MSTPIKYLVVMAVGWLLGWSMHWKLTEPEAVQMVSTPAKRLAHGGLQSESRIEPDAKPQQAVPFGAKVRHVGHATIQPRSLAGDGAVEGKGLPDAKEGAKEGCGPVRLDYTLYQDHGQEFMRLSSPDGDITEGVDSIVSGFRVQPDRSWAVGAGRGPGGRWGLRLDKDFHFAPLRAGIDLQQGADQKPEAWIWGVLRF